MIANFWNLPSLLKYCEIKKTSTKKLSKLKQIASHHSNHQACSGQCPYFQLYKDQGKEEKSKVSM